MSKTAKVLLITAFCALAAWAGLSTLYTYSVSEELTTLRREGRSDMVYLRCRIRDLESELADHTKAPVPSVDTSSEPDNASDSTAVNDVTTDEGEVTSLPSTETREDVEEVTIPVLNSPETTPSETEETEAVSPLVSPYLVASHEGVIGLYDATGALLRTVNVYIMTLPEVDRAALEVGISAESWAEALRLLEMYE